MATSFSQSPFLAAKIVRSTIKRFRFRHNSQLAGRFNWPFTAVNVSLRFANRQIHVQNQIVNSISSHLRFRCVGARVAGNYAGIDSEPSKSNHQITNQFSKATDC